MNNSNNNVLYICTITETTTHTHTLLPWDMVLEALSRHYPGRHQWIQLCPDKFRVKRGV